MKIYWVFPEARWNRNPIPEPGENDPNRAFYPLWLAREELNRKGHEVLPFGALPDQTDDSECTVFSFDGMHRLARDIRTSHRIGKIVHFFMEAPMVGMRYYTRSYQQHVFSVADRVFVQHPSYLAEVFRKSPKLGVFRYAHSHMGVDEALFSAENRKQLVAVNANKGIGIRQSLKRVLQGINPLRYHASWLLRERNKWLHDLAALKRIDVYGAGWDRTALELSHCSYPLENNAWRGTITGPKFDTLARYEFCLCYENSSFPGYITEKIFDCFATGTIPIYRGAPDIDSFLPRELFIDLAGFRSAGELLEHLDGMGDAEKAKYRHKMRAYLAEPENDLFSPLKLSELIVREVPA